ncbi:MAG: sigma-54 dependent transcriptional regulator [Paracoccaceae bacterium]
MTDLSSQSPIDANSIICVSSQEIEQLGGEDVFLQIAKGFKPKKLIVLEENAKEFSMSTALGGRLINLAATSTPVSSEIVSSMLADLMLADQTVYSCGSIKSANTISLVRRVAAKDVTVLVNGPTGTGKEVLSKFIHENSGRKDNPFIAINCAAIPENMLEAMLFGHEKGAFTGASAANQGIFRAADKGTLLLDEISEMPLGLQAKILRVLQERVITPLGGSREINVDVRVIATTNRDMMEEIRGGKFREDLYYRLNVFPIATLALSERVEDIIPIAMALLRKHGENEPFDFILSEQAANKLKEHSWPGNVRELDNVIQRALVLNDGPVIEENSIFLQDLRGAKVGISTEEFLFSKVS